MFCYVAITCIDANVLWFFKPQGYSHVAIVMRKAYNFLADGQVAICRRSLASVPKFSPNR